MNRNEIFDIVATSSEQKLDFGKAYDMTQELVRLHETLRVYGYKNDRMRSVIELHNGVMGRNLLLKHDIGSYDYILDDELAKAHFSKKKDSQGFRMFYLRGSKFGKNPSTLKMFNGSLISTLTNQECDLVEEDEFIREVCQNPIRKQIRERVVGQKGDKILENTFDDRFNGIDLDELQSLIAQEENSSPAKGEMNDSLDVTEEQEIDAVPQTAQRTQVEESIDVQNEPKAEVKKQGIDFISQDGIIQKRIKNRFSNEYTRQDQEEYEQFVADEPEGAVQELIEYLTELHQSKKALQTQIQVLLDIGRLFLNMIVLILHYIE